MAVVVVWPSRAALRRAGFGFLVLRFRKRITLCPHLVDNPDPDGANGDEPTDGAPEEAHIDPAREPREVSPSHTQVMSSVPTDFWCTVEVKLLPKVQRPDRFRFLRPITILPTSCKTFSRVMLHICEE